MATGINTCRPSPGDYGIEGWTADGHVFQCYCPEKDDTQDELYEALRRKITADIPKLHRYAKQIAARIVSLVSAALSFSDSTKSMNLSAASG